MDQDKALEQEALAVGARIAMLLELANIPDDQKESWATMIPDMSLEQIGRLTKYLEANVPEEAKADAEALMEKMQKVQEEHEERVAEAEAKALDLISEIEEEVNES